MMDYSRWEQFMGLLSNIIWWILLALAALAALIYILEHWQDITSLYHKCLAGSVALHLLALLLFIYWRFAIKFFGTFPNIQEFAEMLVKDFLLTGTFRETGSQGHSKRFLFLEWDMVKCTEGIHLFPKSGK